LELNTYFNLSLIVFIIHGACFYAFNALECPPNSHYAICVSSCPETCLGINGPPGCSEKCVEGCECDPGFILSDNKCVPVKDCGCVDSSGSYHPVSLTPGHCMNQCMNLWVNGFK
uniref:TIL domain-containing protein n=1 Tax=Sinocyclocheilus rhinocerous TaxID=307959 RepID=A0A673FRN2_9TELE